MVFSVDVIGGRHTATQITEVSIQHYKVHIPTSSSVYGDVGVPLFSRTPRWGFLYRVIPTPASPGPIHLRKSPVYHRYSAGLSVVLGRAASYAVAGNRHASAGASAVAYAVAPVVEMALVAAVVSVVPAVQIPIKSD